VWLPPGTTGRALSLFRFGDNMRYVAVTDGDKVEAEYKFSFSVNTYGIGDLVKVINATSDAAVDGLIKEYEDAYKLTCRRLNERWCTAPELKDAARIELGLKTFLTGWQF